MPAPNRQGAVANPAFAVAAVFLPLAALGYALTVATLQEHTYVHVMAGVLWTGIDIFMGAVLGPVIGGLGEEESAEVFKRLIRFSMRHSGIDRGTARGRTGKRSD